MFFEHLGMSRALMILFSVLIVPRFTKVCFPVAFRLIWPMAPITYGEGEGNNDRKGLIKLWVNTSEVNKVTAVPVAWSINLCECTYWQTDSLVDSRNVLTDTLTYRITWLRSAHEAIAIQYVLEMATESPLYEPPTERVTIGAKECHEAAKLHRWEIKNKTKKTPNAN